MSRYARKRGHNVGPPKGPARPELYDVSIWVTQQSRGIYIDDKAVEDFTGVKRKSAKQVGILFGGSLIMQTVIGPGIFTSPHGVMEGTGSVALNLLVWAACGIFTTLAALCFAELQIFVKRDGCEYGYIHKAFGPLPSFVYTWMRITVAEPITTAVFALAFSNYLNDTISDNCGPSYLLQKFVPVSIIVTLAVLNTYSLRLARQIQSLANLGKIVTLTVIIGTGIYRICNGQTGELPKGFEDTESYHTKIIYAIYNCLWAYGGWAYVPNVTSAVRRPPKSLPKLIKTVIPSVMVIYLLTMTSYHTVLTREELVESSSFGVIWGRKVLGKASFLIPVGVALIALGNANNTFLSSGRLSSVSVHDGYIPEVLSYVHVKTKSPLPAIILRAASAGVMVLAFEGAMLVRFWVFTVWLFHGLSVFGLLIMRIRKPHLDRLYKVNILIPIFVTLGSAYLVISPFIVLPPSPEFVFSLCLALVSIIFYFPFVRWNCTANKFIDKFTVFLQLFLNIAPHMKHYKRRLKSKHRNGPATVSPVKVEETVVEPPPTEFVFSDAQSDIFTIDTLDTLDDEEDDSLSTGTYKTSGSLRTNVSYRTRSTVSNQCRPPPYEEAVYNTKL